MEILIAWIGLSLLCALVGKDKKIGYGATFALCLLLSPLIGLIIGAVSPEKEKPVQKRIICDGCRKVIEGKYYTELPPGTREKLDYCSKECIEKYHHIHLKRLGIEVDKPEQ